MKRYAIVIARRANYAAYVPDLPGCVATGETVEATQHHGEAIETMFRVTRRRATSA
jgi:predicted RNase H-like HicB family nuclease